MPPSIEIIDPVIPAPASDASSTATRATSSHSFSRLIADCWANTSRSPSYVRPMASAAGGPRLDGDGNKVGIGDLESARDVHEDDGYTLDQEGISIDDVSDVTEQALEGEK